MKKVTTVDVGAKVIRGPDWEYEDQDKGSVYGIIKSDSKNGWVTVEWISKDGKVVNSNVYRIGNDDKYDLCYYEEPSTIDSVQGFRIGDVVDYSGHEAKILSFRNDLTACVIEYTSHKEGHDGSLHDYWYNEKGESIPYIKGDRRWYVSLKDLKHTSKPKQRFKTGKWYWFKSFDQRSVTVAKCDDLYFENDLFCSNNWVVIGGNKQGASSGAWDFRNIHEEKELSIEEVQQYLPDGHPDKISKIDDILQQCYTKYPVGTKYKCANNGNQFVVTQQNFKRYDSNTIHGEHAKGCLYYKGKFAEIVSHEIPINYQPQLTDEQVEKFFGEGIITEISSQGAIAQSFTENSFIVMDCSNSEIEPVESVSTPLLIKKRSYIYF